MYAGLLLLVENCALVLVLLVAVDKHFLHACDGDCLVLTELCLSALLFAMIATVCVWYALRASPLTADRPPKRKFDTTALDGLRGFCTVYVAIYHYIKFYDPFDLIATCLMNFFYLLSGFVLTLGYGDRRFAARDFYVKRFARVVPMYILSNIPMLLAGIYFYHNDAEVLATGGYLGMTFTTTFTFARYAPWNDVTWTIQVFVWLYVCYPLIAPRLRSLPLARMRPAAALSYAAYVALATLVFAGLPARAGWKSGSLPGLEFGAAYNVAFVNLPVFVMGCCAGYEALYATPPPPALAHLYRCGGVGSVATGAAAACAALFGVGIGCIQALSGGAAPAGPFAHGDGEGTLVTFVVMLLIPPVAYDLILALCAYTPPAEGAAAGGGGGGGGGGGAMELALLEVDGSAPRRGVWELGLAFSFFRWKPLLFMASISLPFYMIHTVVLTFLLWGNEAHSRLWAAPVGFPLAIALAWLLTHYFEKPAGNFLVNKLTQKKKSEKKTQPEEPRAPVHVVEMEVGSNKEGKA